MSLMCLVFCVWFSEQVESRLWLGYVSVTCSMGHYEVFSCTLDCQGFKEIWTMMPCELYVCNVLSIDEAAYEMTKMRKGTRTEPWRLTVLYWQLSEIH